MTLSEIFAQAAEESREQAEYYRNTEDENVHILIFQAFTRLAGVMERNGL